MRASGRSAERQIVCFSAADYAGFWRRTVVELIDVAAILVLLFVLLMIAAILAIASGGMRWVFDEGAVTLFTLIVGVATLYWYLVILKRSRFKTLGYRLARVRVVDVYGQPPGLGALSVRLLFSILGPFNIVLDLVWIPSDRYKQSLRDKVAHTYVVRADAQSVGPGRVTYRQYYLLGMSFVFQELEPMGSLNPRSA